MPTSTPWSRRSARSPAGTSSSIRGSRARFNIISGAPRAAKPRLSDAARRRCACRASRCRGRRQRGRDRPRGRRQAAGRRRCATGPVAGGDRLVTQVIHAALRVGGATRQRPAPADHAEQYDRGVPERQRARSLPTTPTTCGGSSVSIASLDQPPGGEPIVVPLRFASAIDLVPLLNRLIADAATVPAAGAPPTPSSA